MPRATSATRSTAANGAGATVGWHHWPPTVQQLAILARGIADLDRAARVRSRSAVRVDLDGLRAVIHLLTQVRR